MATTATAASSSSSTGGGLGVEETADEVKVFRSSTQEDDPNELAGSSADLNADKQELALEADIESQSDFSQRVNPIFSPLGPLPWPSPGNNFLYNLAALSPVFHQKLATMAMAQTYAAAAANCIARLSPHYMNLGGGGGLGAFERPPAFSMPCTPTTNGTARNVGGQQQSGPNPLQMNSPMSGLSGSLGGVTLSADRAVNGQQRHHQNQHQKTSNNNRTPKREKAERKEKSSAKSSNDKKEEHIKKPMNAFMWFMKENRHKYMEECGGKRKQSAELNKELGQIWQKLSKDEQQPYYEKAQVVKEEHQKLYPNWTASENYAIHKRVKKRRIRERSLENNEQKKCRARFGVDNQAKWCKHCRRKKRCLNVRDADSPVQVSSTTNPTTPSSIAGPSNAASFNHLIGMFATSQSQQDSPHSSRKDYGQSTSELSRCSSTISSTTSNMSADEGPEGQQNMEKEKMAQQNCFKLELLEAPKATTGTSHPTTQLHNELPKPVPNAPNGFPIGAPHQAINGVNAPPPNASPFQMTPAPQQLGFPFPAQFMMPYLMPNFMKQ